MHQSPSRCNTNSMASYMYIPPLLACVMYAYMPDLGSIATYTRTCGQKTTETAIFAKFASWGPVFTPFSDLGQIRHERGSVVYSTMPHFTVIGIRYILSPMDEKTNFTAFSTSTFCGGTTSVTERKLNAGAQLQTFP